MRKRNLLVSLPLLLAGCAPPPAEPSAVLTPAPEVALTDEVPIIDGTPAPTTLTSTPAPVVAVTAAATVASTPEVEVSLQTGAVILPTPTNVAPTPTPIPRNAREEVRNLGEKLDKALLKAECESVITEANKRSRFYEEIQAASEKDKDTISVDYCIAARGAMSKMVLAANTKAEILKGERHYTQMANVGQMISDAVSAAP